MRWVWIALGAVFLAYPWVLAGPFYERMGALVLLAAISGSAWNLLGGYAGQASVGHAIFYGAGAYLPLLVFTQWGLPPIAGLPAGIAVSVLIALVIGIPTFRLLGHYFTMATVAVAELVRLVVSNWDLLGAAVGLSGPAVSRGWWDLSFRSSIPYYYIFLAVLAVVLLVTWQMERSRMGFYLRAIKAGDRAARSLGVPVRRYKLYALMLSAAFTSVAGSLYALMVGFVDPDSGLGILISIEMLIIAALGGAGTLFGPLLGAVILIPLQNATNSWFGGSGSGATYVIYGGIIMLIARYQPGGLMNAWHALQERRHRRAAAVEPRHAA
ncbi:MAG: branched-chain amino acid ABC transporter permease [Proteobacteria bacterium]|nr:branched-chain amino acid ABC transporter permease [Pseudomonadota bacterium]